MHKLFATFACTAALAATLPAHALTLVSIFAPHGNQAAARVDNAALPTIAADIGFAAFGPVAFEFELATADVDGLAGFNAVITNRTGSDISALELVLYRGTFALAGSVTPAFGTVASMTGGEQRQRITFAPAEPFGIDIGNPFSAAGGEDWLIGLAGLAAGERFTLTVSAVPEPSAWVLALAGAGLLAGVRRRRSAAAR